jgi:hypothetical protein
MVLGRCWAEMSDAALEGDISWLICLCAASAASAELKRALAGICQLLYRRADAGKQQAAQRYTYEQCGTANCKHLKRFSMLSGTTAEQDVESRSIVLCNLLLRCCN